MASPVNGQSTDYSNPQEARKVKLHYFRGEFTSLVGGLNPSEKYESIGMISNPILMGKCKIDGNHSPPTSFSIFAATISIYC